MERFLTQPNINYYAGLTVNKDTVVDDFKVGDSIQSIKNLTLTIKTYSKREFSGLKILEKGVITIKLPEGYRLSYNDIQGYFAPTQKLYTAQEVIDEIEIIKE